MLYGLGQMASLLDFLVGEVAPTVTTDASRAHTYSVWIK